MAAVTAQNMAQTSLPHGSLDNVLVMNNDHEAVRALAVINTKALVAAMFDLPGAVLFLNETAAATWDHLSSLDKPSAALNSIFDDPTMGDLIRELLERQDEFSDELMLQTAHGVKLYSCAFTKVVDPIKMLPTIVLVAKDMSESWECAKVEQEKKRLQREQDIQAVEEAKLAAIHEKHSAAAARQIFCATASHELRTPVQSLTTCLELIKKLPLVQPEWMAEASDAILQMNEILVDLIDFVRVDAEEPSKQKIVDIDAFIHRTLEPLEKRAATKHLGFEVTIGQSAKIHALLFEGRVRQVLINVVGNAIKYTTTGGITINVQYNTDSASSDHSRLFIVVSDTGVGMALETVSTLMFPFTRGAVGRLMDEQGLGLGLAIVQTHLIEMGGSIAIVPNVRGGTDAQIVIPCKQTHAI